MVRGLFSRMGPFMSGSVVETSLGEREQSPGSASYPAGFVGSTVSAVYQ